MYNVRRGYFSLQKRHSMYNVRRGDFSLHMSRYVPCIMCVAVISHSKTTLHVSDNRLTDENPRSVYVPDMSHVYLGYRSLM